MLNALQVRQYRDAKVQWRKVLANEEETKEALIRYFHLESYFPEET